MYKKRAFTQLLVAALLGAAVLVGAPATANADTTYPYKGDVHCFNNVVGMWIHQGANSGWANLSGSGPDRGWSYNLRPNQLYAVSVGCGAPPKWPTSRGHYVRPNNHNWFCTDAVPALRRVCYLG